MPVSFSSDRPMSRAVQWTAHHATWTWAALFVSIVAGDAFPANTVMGIVSFGVTVVALWTMVATWQHGLMMCPRCAAAVPLDGQATAARRARALRWTHAAFNRSRLVVIGGIGALLALNVAVTALTHTRFEFFLYVICAWNVATTYLMSVHQPLQPWCPGCHWGDGDDEDVPDPVPDPEDHAALVQ